MLKVHIKSTSATTLIKMLKDVGGKGDTKSHSGMKASRDDDRLSVR